MESDKIELMPKRSGFTLIELLITISIIAILSAIGLVIFSTVMKQGRDAKRQSDLRSIQSALEQYYSDQGFYPYSTSGFDPLLTEAYNRSSFTSSIGNPSVPPPSPVKTYLNSVPRESLAAPYLRYGYITTPAICDNASTKCTSYCLYANLENPGTVTKPAACTGSWNFAVTPP